MQENQQPILMMQQQIFDAQRLHRPNRGRINGHAQPNLVSTYVSNQQGGSNSGIASYSGRTRGDGSEMLSSMLSTASPEIQKQMLGECIYPLVYQHEERGGMEIWE
nr:polyadenylate-binding protein 7 isoform X2 [Tanacetum cinerariifolium]